MPFQPNHKLSTGRPKGSGNKDVAEIREAFKLLIENNLDQLQKDMDELGPKDRLKFIVDLSGFVIPKLKATDLNVAAAREGFAPPITISFID